MRVRGQVIGAPVQVISVQVIGARGLRVHPLLFHARPFVGVFKSQFIEDLSTFGDKYPRNGSNNEEMAPRTRMECPHEGPRVDPFHGRANSAHIRQSGLDSGSDVRELRFSKSCKVFPPRSEAVILKKTRKMC